MSATNVPRSAVISFTICIAMGFAMVVVTSTGIQNAKRKKGGKYWIQVMGLIASIFWTLGFFWKLGKATGANAGRNFQGQQALNAQLHS